MLILLALLCLLILPSPWDGIAFVVLLALGCVEIAFWWRTVRRRRVQTGAEAMIGSSAKVISACRPQGEVWVNGARWRAYCPDGADVGDVVTVTDRKELLLIVGRPVPPGTGTAPVEMAPGRSAEGVPEARGKD